MSASTSYGILTTVGLDQIGYVNKVTDFLAEKHANVEIQTCAKLGGYYVTSTWFSATPESMSIICNSVHSSLSAYHPQLLPVDAPITTADASASSTDCLLSLFAQDSPGILRQLTELLARKHVTVASMAASTYPAPFQGAPVFMAELKLCVSNTNTIRWLAASIEAWEARYGWDLTLEIETPEKPLKTLVPHHAPYPPGRLFEQVSSAAEETAWGYRLPEGT